MLNAISGLVVFSVLFANQLFAQPRKPATVSEISTYLAARGRSPIFTKTHGIAAKW